MPTMIDRRGLLRSGLLVGGALATPGVLDRAAFMTAADAAEAAHITMLMSGGTGTLHMLQDMISRFHKQYPAIGVKPSVVPWTNFDQRIDLLLAAGTPPGLWGPYGNRGYRYYASRGYFPSIDQEIAADKYDLRDFYKPLIDFCTWNGHYVGLPNDLIPGVLLYNKTLFDKAGLPHPPTDWNDKSWTYDKFLEYAKALTVRQGAKTVQYGIDAPQLDYRFPFWLFGGDAFDERAYVSGYPRKVTLNTPAVIDGLQFISDLLNKWKVQPTPAEVQALQGGGPSLFGTGKIGMSPETGGSWLFLSSGYGSIKSFEWGVAALPWPPKRYGLPRKTPLFPDQWLVFKGQKYPQACWALQKWMAGPEGITMWATAQGTLPSRKSLSGLFQTLVKDAPRDSVLSSGVESHRGW